jgi:hypothetical protein
LPTAKGARKIRLPIDFSPLGRKPDIAGTTLYMSWLCRLVFGFGSLCPAPSIGDAVG